MSGEIINLNSGNPHKIITRRTRTTSAVRHNSYTNRCGQLGTLYKHRLQSYRYIVYTF